MNLDQTAQKNQSQLFVEMSERKAERAEVIDEGEVEENDENSFYLAIYNINLFGKLLAKNVDISGSEAFFGYG